MRKADWSTRPLEDELGEVLRAELLSWPGVQTRPMMGALAFFRGKHMLGCYVNRALSKKKPQWLGRPGEPTYAWMRLREGGIYFDGSPQELLAAQDPYLQRYLA